MQRKCPISRFEFATRDWLDFYWNRHGTKPTMGAFIWGVLCYLGSNAAFTLQKGEWLERFGIIVATGIASIPLGAAWYIRNILNGHPPIDLPPGYWQTLAAQSGVEFVGRCWRLLLLWLISGGIGTNPYSITYMLVGLALVLFG